LPIDYQNKEKIKMKDMTVMVANLMGVAARTAPKAGGKDFLEIVVIDQDNDLQKIASAMKDYAPRSTNEAYWLRDAANIENSQALVLIGLTKPNLAGYDCGGCGFATCKEFEQHRKLQDKEMGYTARIASWMMDIGVALASAAKTASLMNVDNRVQQRVAATARALGYIKTEVAMGIPVSVTGKSIYYDRPTAAKH
jgi:uncharacterized ferredoxin-like protein